MKFGVLIFPGSNCDRDCLFAAEQGSGSKAIPIWHKDTVLPKVDALIVPGGFSFGDYLRCGAIARFSPIMDDVLKFAEAGGPVLGICNGFQILTEIGLLPGVLLRNKSLRFLCEPTYLRVESTESPFTKMYSAGQVVNMPIAHHDGNFYADDATLDRIEGEGQVLFRYANVAGEVDPTFCANGSARNIAGIRNGAGNVVGMMPHPDRVADPLLGCSDGLAMFQ